MGRARILLTVVLAAALALGAAALLTRWLVIAVHPEGRQGFTLPIPLSAVRVAAALLPGDAVEDMELPPKLLTRREAILQALATLQNLPDTTLASVQSPEAGVSIATRRGLLLIHVSSREDHTSVRCRIPLNGVLTALRRLDSGSADPRVFLTVLREAPRGPLVRVSAPDATVAIGIW